jgi:hypothetical protein
MNTTSFQRSAVVAGICLALLTGCPGGGAAQAKTYKVTGTVAYNNQPVVGAKVSFMAEGATRPATGLTDKDGKFELSTYGVNDGAIAGEHKIVVVQEESTGATVAPTTDKLSMNPADMAKDYVKSKDENKLNLTKMKLPIKYASQQSTPLKENVKSDGDNHFNLILQDG